eukprot:Clim_evm24s44 gene=Clim_evmTU24s44
MPVRILKDSEVVRLRDKVDWVSASRTAFQSMVNDGLCPPRTVLNLSAHYNGAATLFKPAFVPEDPGKAPAYLGAKTASVRPDNAQHSRPIVPAFIQMINSETGVLEGLLDATFLTAIRTAAGSVVSCEVMRTEQPPPEILAVYGGGLQARLHIELLVEKYRESLKLVKIWTRNQQKGEDLARSLEQSLQVQISWDPEPYRSADIIVTATNAYSPVLSNCKLKKGSHICAVGSFKPEMQELGQDVVETCLVVSDALSMADVKAGDLLKVPPGSVRYAGNIGDVVSGKVKVQIGDEHYAQGLTSTLFECEGTSIQDVVTAGVVLAAAEEHKVGQIVDFM